MLEEVRPGKALSEMRARRDAPEEKIVVMMVLKAVVTWRLLSCVALGPCIERKDI
ncbi:hypothetical protein GR205_27480 [Rhizobium leguminosarum]|uniref:hypothetical protein n=1 Tax=Rhizobium ruizarguesonis TaxID=2081791 RepID=UPI0013DF7149|nr:hypothetical protein [Rhizobium ruizarguesonis]NEJ31720.1 hypothetical protein [Rhizobium ruizarguesonis]